MSPGAFTAAGEVPRERGELDANHQQVAEFPIALRDAQILSVLRFDAVLQALVPVEVADILLVRVHELVDIEDGVELLPLAPEVVVEEEGDVDGVLEVRRVGARVVVGCGESDGELFVGRALSGLSVKPMFELIFGMSFVKSDRRTESRSWMSMSPKDGRKRSKETRRGFFTFLTWWILPEDVLRRIEVAGREEGVAVAQLWHVVAKEVAIEALSETSLLALDKQHRVDGGRGAAVMVGCLMAFAFSP